MSEVLFMCSALLVDVAGVVPVESDVVHVLITVSAAIANFREVWISKSLVIHVIEGTTGFLLRPGVVALECMGEVGFRNVN